MTHVTRLLAMAGVLVLSGCQTPNAAPKGETWLAYGDSIIHGAFHNQVASQFPGVQVVGMPGVTSAEAVSHLDATLQRFPAARHVAVGLGTNDVHRGNSPSSFRSMMRVTAEKIRATGRTVHFARIPYSTNPRMANAPAFNQELATLEAELGLKPGPDFYSYFQTHPEQLGADGMHPNGDGNQAIQRMWAETAKAVQTP